MEAIPRVQPPQGLAKVPRVRLHLFEHDADHLNQACLRGVLVDWVSAGDVNVIERAHDLEQASLVDLSGACCHYRQQCADHLQLDLLVPLCRALADLVDDGVDQPSRQRPVALRLLFLGVEAVVRVVAIDESVGNKALDMVQDLFCQTRHLRVQGQLKDAEVLVGAQRLVIRISLHLSEASVAKVSQLFAFSRDRLLDLL